MAATAKKTKKKTAPARQAPRPEDMAPEMRVDDVVLRDKLKNRLELTEDELHAATGDGYVNSFHAWLVSKRWSAKKVLGMDHMPASWRIAAAAGPHLLTVGQVEAFAVANEGRFGVLFHEGMSLGHHAWRCGGAAFDEGGLPALLEARAWQVEQLLAIVG